VLRLAFLSSDAPLDYSSRIGRLRWRRALGVTQAAELSGDDPPARLEGAEICVLVRESRALPAPLERPPRAGGATAVPCVPLAVALAGPVHTLRELERGGWPAVTAAFDASAVPAVAFRPGQIPSLAGENVREYASRLFSGATGEVDPAFRALVFDDPPEHDRPELVQRLPESARRLCDVGCGAGAAGAAWKRRSGGHVTGVEKDAIAAGRARSRLDRVLEGEASAVLADLAAAGETFDAFLFGDVLEHLEDPIGALAGARNLAAPAATLVASVPNVGHLSLVRDLVLGRFDVLPAGLADAGHLRWFSRSFLGEALEEAGWQAVVIEGLPGGPIPNAPEFLRWSGGFREADRESLTTYQWMAVASPK
jgi:2-polyprenyl-3-methyl-5-hydroxy-6-metoxy-1,4-benzoquinol methylase